jgi:uncharacterized membrane protein
MSVRIDSSAAWARKATAFLAAVLCAVFAIMTLYSAFSAFTTYKFALVDYGKYVNMIWNCGHGRPFRMLTDESYLHTHLSFSLALLGPFFRLWDHPFLLAVLQWLAAVVGMLIIWRVAVRRGVPGDVTAALLLFFAANPYTQSVLLSEFHGVALCLLLIPWLYYCLVFRRSLVWLPLLLLLGLREDAAFALVPMLLYFAIRERWRPGYLLAAVTTLYGAFACTWLYQWISQQPITRVRPSLSAQRLLLMLRQTPLLERLRPFLWLLAPAVVSLRTKWLAVLVFPSFALLMAFFSPYPAQFTLSVHYPAAALALLIVGMLHSLSDSAASGGLRRPALSLLTAWALIAVTLLGHVERGFLPGGGRSSRHYEHPRLYGLATLQAARRIPRQGLLLCTARLAGFCANRADLLTWEYFDPRRHRPDLVFCKLQDFSRKEGRTLLEWTTGDFGVRFFDGENVILERGADTAQNAEVVQAWRESGASIYFAYTPKDEGSDLMVEGGRIVRFWQPASGGAAAPLISRGESVTLPAGRYRGRLRLRVEGRGETGAGDSGLVNLYEYGTERQIASLKIRADPPTNRQFRDDAVLFDLARETRVEPRVRAGRASLWLEKIVFELLSNPAEPSAPAAVDRG